MSLTTSSNTRSETQPDRATAAAAPLEPANDRSERHVSTSPPMDRLNVAETTSTAVMRRGRHVRDPPSPRRSNSSPAPPPHILSTARCSTHAASETRPSDESRRKKDTSRSRSRLDERTVLSGRGLTTKTVLSSSSGRASAALPERKKDAAAKKRAKMVTRTMGTLQPREKDTATAAAAGSAGISGRASHGQRSSSTSKTPVSTPSSTPPQAASGLGIGSGRLSVSGSTSAKTSARATTPPSARTSAVVEAFLLGVQNCLSKQELLFQRLSVKLTQIEGRSAASYLPRRTAQPTSSTGSTKSDSRKSEPQTRLLSPSLTNATSSDNEADAGPLRYSVGTPTETHLPASQAATATSSHGESGVGSVAAAPETEMVASSDPLAQTLTSPHTPSCSVVVVHPSLGRATMNPTPASLSHGTETALPAATTGDAAAAAASSPLTSPNYLRLENIEVTTSTSATPSSLSEALGLLSPSASDTSPSSALLRPMQRRPNGGSPASTTPSTAAPLPSFSRAGLTYIPPASFAQDANTRAVDPNTNNTHSNHAHPPQSIREGDEADGEAEEENNEDADVRRDSVRAVGRTGVVPQRRSSAVQWEGGFVVYATPAGSVGGASRTPLNAVNAAERYTPILGNTTPPSSASNPPALPTLPGEAPDGWGISPLTGAAGAVGNGNLRLTTVSNAMSLLTSADSVTLSPLSRPASTWGGSPMTHSVLSGGSPGALPRNLQLSQQAYGTMNNSLNTIGGTPGSTRSPSGTAVRGGSGSSPRQRNASTTAAAGGGAASSSYSPALFNFVSPPSAAAISSSESPFAFKGTRSPQLQANVLSSSSSVLSNRNTLTALEADGGAAAPTQLRRLHGDVLSPLSASSSSPSLSPTTMSRRASVTLNRNTSGKPGEEGLPHFSSTFVSANSLDEEAKASQSGHAGQRSSSSNPTSRNGHSAPTLPCFPERADEEEDDGSNYVIVSMQSPVLGSGSLGFEKGGGVTLSISAPTPAAGPTHRQLTLPTSPSVERASQEDEELEGLAEKQREPEPFHDEGDDDGGLVDAAMNSDASTESNEDDGEGEEEDKAETTPIVAAVSNPFAIPPPPPSLSELHAHQQQRRLSAAPVRTMRRPPMAPSRTGNTADDAANGLNEGLDEVSGPSAQLEQWLSFERQHEQTHLPACWRDSEVVVVDHVEEEDRERDEEAAAQLRLMEAELMSGWQVTPSGSEKEESQAREAATAEDWRLRHSGRRHSYPGSTNWSSDRDRQLHGGSEAELTDDAAANPDDGNNNNENDDDDDREWDDEVDVEESYQERLAQYGRMVLLQHRRSLHAPRYRGQSTTNSGSSSSLISGNSSNMVNNGSAGEGGAMRSTSPGGHASHRHHHRTEKKDEVGGTEGRSNAAFPASAVAASCTEERGRTGQRSSAETSETHRLFRRGNSAPVVVSDGGSADWQTLQARFNELVNIQQRVRGGGDDNSSGSTNAVTAAGGSPSHGDREAGDGSGRSLQSAAEGFQRTNSGRQASSRARGCRGRSFSHREAAGSPFPAVDSDASANIGATQPGSASSNNNSNDEKETTHRLPEPVDVATSDENHTSTHSDNDLSTAAALSSSSAAAFIAKGRRGTLVYQDVEVHEATTANATEAVGSPSPLPDRGELVDRAETPPSDATAATDAEGKEDERKLFATEHVDPHSNNNRNVQNTALAAVLLPLSTVEVHRGGLDGSPDSDATERSHSAPPAQSIGSTTPLKADSRTHVYGGTTTITTTPERPHRTGGITAVHKVPPAFLAGLHATFTVAAGHTVLRSVAASTVATAAGNERKQSPPIMLDPALVEMPREADPDVEEKGCSAATTADDREASCVNDAAARAVEGTRTKRKASVATRPQRTPRLRFTHTPRATTRPNALGRGRRVVILHSGAAEPSSTKATTDETSEDRRTGRTVAAGAVTVASPQREKPRVTTGSGDGRKTTAKKKKAGSRGGAGRATRHSDAASASITEAPQIPDEAAVPMTNDNDKDGHASLAASSSKSEQPLSPTAVSLSANHLALQHDDAMEGGEIVEPLPLGISTTSHTDPLSPTSLSATITTTVTTAAAEEGKGSTAVAATAAQPAVSATPKTEKKGKKTASAPTTGGRRKSLGADADLRSSLLSQKDGVSHKSATRAPQGSTTAGESDSKRPVESTSGATEAVSATSESRTLLRRLAQSKDRTRAMEERLRVNSGNFTSVSAALALPTAEGEDSVIVDSAASTPMRSALKSHTLTEAAHATPGLEGTPQPPHKSEDANPTDTVTSPITAPLTAPEDTNASISSGGGGGRHPNSEQRHVSVVEPVEGPAVPAAAAQHVNASAGLHLTSAAAGGKTHTRRRLADVRTRPTASKPASASTAASASTTTGTGHRHTQNTGRVASLSAASPAATVNTSVGSATAADSGAGSGGGSNPSAYTRRDSARAHTRAASPPQERRRHTIGDAPFSAMSERRLRPTRTMINN